MWQRGTVERMALGTLRAIIVALARLSGKPHGPRCDLRCGLVTLRLATRPELPFQIVKEDDRIVVFRVVRAVEQGYRAVSCGVQNRLQGHFVLLEFGPITALELRPLLGIVAEPLSKIGTRRNILQPYRIGKRRLLHAPWPQPLNEKLLAIIFSRRFIYALQLDHVLPRFNR